MFKLLKWFLIVTLFLTPSFIYAETPAKGWSDFNMSVKIGFVSGFQRGYDFGFRVNRNMDQLTEGQKRMLKNITDTDTTAIVSAVDKFYSDYANCNIPWYLAVLHVIQRINGIPEDELQKELENERGIFSKNK